MTGVPGRGDPSRRAAVVGVATVVWILGMCALGVWAGRLAAAVGPGGVPQWVAVVALCVPLVVLVGGLGWLRWLFRRP